MLGCAKFALIASLLLCAGNTAAQSVEKEKEHAVIELGGGAFRNVTDGASSFGPAVGVEVTPIKNWLELEFGTAALFRRHSTEWGTDLLFKKPWDLSPKVEFMLGLGPEWVHSKQYGVTTNSLSVEAVADFMFWRSPTNELKSWFSALQQTAIVQASSVKCIGMHSPIPLREIYQPTRLRVKGLNLEKRASSAFQDRISRSIAQAEALYEHVLTVQEFLKRRENAIVYAGPGWGKTTFLHHVFLSSISRKELLPVLISLRRPTAVQDLQKFVGVAKKIQKKQDKSQALLLVDGYDELPIIERKRVSDALLHYHALNIGSFYVTCREYYQVFEIAAPEVRIDAFTREDQYRYVDKFLTAFGSTLDSTKVVDEFHERGFEDFLSHPLLLALACIVKSSAQSIDSRSVLRLLERAIDVLTYRWDEEKGIDRQRKTTLDGRDRIHILKRIAYKTRVRYVLDSRALMMAKEQLDLMHFDKVDPREVLVETAQFFGIFVPSEEGWEFVHKTLHDYLAAQFWVETGGFANTSSVEWDARTAYAACLTQDATSVMERALSSPGGVEAFVEILSNSPTFEHKRIANALINYYAQHERQHYYQVDENDELKVTANLEEDFVCLASSRFLDYLVERCCTGRGKTTDTIAGYCMMELLRRKRKLTFGTYEKALAVYKSDKFTFNLMKLGHLRLSSMNPGEAPSQIVGRKPY